MSVSVPQISESLPFYSLGLCPLPQVSVPPLSRSLSPLLWVTFLHNIRVSDRLLFLCLPLCFNSPLSEPPRFFLSVFLSELCLPFRSFSSSVSEHHPDTGPVPLSLGPCPTPTRLPAPPLCLSPTLFPDAAQAPRAGTRSCCPPSHCSCTYPEVWAVITFSVSQRRNLKPRGGRCSPAAPHQAHGCLWL